MDHRVREVIRFMNDNLHRRLSVHDLSGSVCLSPSHLGQLFKEQTGTSVARYLRELRLLRAKELLETTFLSVKQIAANVGIGSVSHFATDFKKAYGSKPSEHVSRGSRTARKNHRIR